MTRRHGVLVAIVAVLVAGFADERPSAQTTASQAPVVTTAQLNAAIDQLGAFDLEVRTKAAATIRRAFVDAAAPALTTAAKAHKDEYVRYRALVLLSGFGTATVPDTMKSLIGDRDDRIRTVVYEWLERHPDPSQAPALIAALDRENTEFVRPALTRALAALPPDDHVRAAVLPLVTRGPDPFRGAVIVALGEHKAAFAADAIAGVAKLDGPLQDDSIVALGEIGDRAQLPVLSALQKDAPAERRPAIAAAVCLMGLDCDQQQGYLVTTVTFALTQSEQASLLGLGARPGRPGRPRAPRRHRGADDRGRAGAGSRAWHRRAGPGGRGPAQPDGVRRCGRQTRRSGARDYAPARRIRYALGRRLRAGAVLRRDSSGVPGRARWIAAPARHPGAHRQAGVLTPPHTAVRIMSHIDYRQSGVDIDAGNEVVRRIKALARGTYTPGVLSGVGAFGGLFAPDARVKDPVLVASADGVGTKLKVAFMTGVHDTIGADLVNHCVNDILVQGARPMFFLDYLATGRLSPDVAEQIVRGIAGACRENGCALLGGETAEMPGFYADGEYDVAGFIVGLVERSHVIDGRDIAAGDVLVALPSSGLHTNGYRWRARSPSRCSASASIRAWRSLGPRSARRSCGRIVPICAW